MLKIGKQIGGIFLATNKAKGLEGVEYPVGGVVVQYIFLIVCKIQPVDGYVSSFNNKRL